MSESVGMTDRHHLKTMVEFHLSEIDSSLTDELSTVVPLAIGKWYNADMRLALKQHSDSHCEAVAQIEVEVTRPHATNLLLHYFVRGTISDLRISPMTAPMRADELWRHTCFEAFLQTSSSTAYYEFNFAPSGQWAAYRFSEYRRGMVIADVPNAPKIETLSNSAWYELKVLLELNGLSNPESKASWRLGLSAVIEESAGHTSYWALEHPTGKPDFHRADCFTSEIAAALGS